MKQICKRCRKRKAEAFFYGIKLCRVCYRIVRWKEKALEKRLSELRRGRFLVRAVGYQGLNFGSKA